MNNLDRQYKSLLQDILDNGVEKKDRTGTGTLSVFGRQIRHKMSSGFPLLTTKKMAWKQVAAELLWFLRGDTNIKFLVDNNCHIWDGDAYKNYEKAFTHPIAVPNHDKLNKEEFINKIKTDDEFAKKWGELGPIYGAQWRGWPAWVSGDIEDIDQLGELIKDLQENPDSRRLMVSAWNVGELSRMVLPPCHHGFQIYTRELTWEEQVQWVMRNTDVELENVYIVEEIAKETTPKRAISLMWNQRSVDTFLGLPFNIASYGLLLSIIANKVNMVPDELVGNLGDTHLYLNHLDQAREQIGTEIPHLERFSMLREKMTMEDHADVYYMSPAEQRDVMDSVGVPSSTREPFKLPKLVINSEFWNHDHKTLDGYFNSMDVEDFIIKNYQHHPAIKALLSN
jgi:thymidylate synthase